MFKTKKTPLNPETATIRWNYLVKWERRLKRNVLLCRIIQPLGAVIFTLNMLLATMNLLFAVGKWLDAPAVTEALKKGPILPAMVSSFPRETVKEALGFSLWFVFLIPLLISAVVFFVLLALDLYKIGRAHV